MESKKGIVLRHMPTGLYWSYKAEHTKHLWSAWRWGDIEEAAVWLQNSYYRPDKPKEYEFMTVNLTIELEVESSEREHGDL